jgi:putrescine transport system permease protein
MRFFKKLSASFSSFLDERMMGRKFLISLPYVWLIIFFLLPLFIIFQISLSESILGVPPYSHLLEWTSHFSLKIHLHFENYKILFEDSLYQYAFIQSLKLAASSTLLCLFLGYPMAYMIARAEEKTQTLLLFLILLPFWTSFLLRVYAWIGLLSREGIINNFLMGMGFINTPLNLIGTDFSVCLGMVYCYLPFMILPLYATLHKFDVSLLEAAADLGCPPFKTFLKITLPLSRGGIIAGCLLVFIPCMGEFVIPELLGSSESYVLGKVIWTEFFNNRDWPMAASVAICMVLFMVLPIVLIQKVHERYRG